MNRATVVLAVVLIVAVSGCSQEGSSATPQASSLTDREIAIAERLVAQELQKAGDDAQLDGASAALSTKAVTQPNTGNRCDADRLILVQMRGSFPHTVTSGGPPAAGGTADTASVSAMLLTADSESELVCLIAVETGDVEPLPGGVSLHIG